MANSGALLRPFEELWTAASKLQVIVDKSRSIVLDENYSTEFIYKHLYPGSIAEIKGLRSSGKSSICLHVLAQATRRGEICAVVDLNDSFDPASAAAAGARLEQILWVRCRGNAEHTMRTADLLLHAGGFGVVLLDLCEAPARVLDRIPLSHWYRFRRAVEHTPTILLVCSDTHSQPKSSCSSDLQLERQESHWSGKAPFLRLKGLEIRATPRKPASLRPERLLLPAGG